MLEKVIRIMYYSCQLFMFEYLKKRNISQSAEKIIINIKI